MKNQAQSIGKVRFTEDQLVKSWTTLVPKDLWPTLVKSMNFSGEYPKGTQTSVKHITYHQALNKIAEMIRINNKSRFRTETEIFKIALHLGMQILYHVFASDNVLEKDSRIHFFYKAFEATTHQMERASIIATLDEAMGEFNELLRKDAITPEEVKEALHKLYKSLPEEDRDYVQNYFTERGRTQVTNIKSKLRTEFGNLLC